MPRLTAGHHLRSIRHSLAAIERSVKQLATSLNGSLGSAPTAPRRLKLSPKRRAALKLHGRYLGHMRQLKPRQKAKVKAAKAKSGYHAAIAMAKTLGDRG
jgi:hypothetical protein